MIAKYLSKHLPKREDLAIYAIPLLATISGIGAQDYAFRHGQGITESFLYGVDVVSTVFLIGGTALGLYVLHKNANCDI